MPTDQKEQQKTTSTELEFNCSDIPGLYNIVDTSEGECIGYIGYFCGDVTFYPKAQQAYSAETLAIINAKCQQKRIRGIQRAKRNQR